MQDRPVDGIYSDGGYLTRNPSWHVEDSPWKARQIERILRQNAVNPRSIAEVGCGAGEILVQLQKAFPNSELSGFEVSPQAFALCQEREGERIHFHLKDLLEEQTAYFDVLLAIDVFEHIDDYLGFSSRSGTRRGSRSSTSRSIFRCKRCFGSARSSSSATRSVTCTISSRIRRSRP